MKTINPERTRCPYDVGDVLITASSAQPSTRWPGTTWSQIKDIFPLAAGDTYKAGSTGGEATHLLTTEEMPAHAHNFNINSGSPAQKNEVSAGTYNDYAWWEETRSAGVTDYTGDNQPHNNMPPYKAFYMWQRTK